MKCSNSFFSVITTIALTCIFFSSCSPSIVLKVKNDTSGTAFFNGEMSPISENLVQRFSGTGENGEKKQLFDKDKVVISLAHAGFKVESLTFPPRTGIALSLSFLKLDGVLNQAIVAKKDSNHILVTLSRESVNAAIDLLPPDTRDYLDLLMAPIFTGETLDSTAYEAAIGAAYGKTLMEELKKSAFTLSIHCPSAIQKASITNPGNAHSSGSVAVFSIPLSALLTLESPVTASVAW